MKTRQIKYRIYMIAITLIALIQSCKKENAVFPLDNRCGDPSVTCTQNNDYSNIFSTAINQLSAGNIVGSLQTSSGKTLWFVNNALLNGNSGSARLDNCLLLKDGSNVTVIYNSASAIPQSLIPAASTDSWYTINNAIESNGQYQLIVSLIKKTGPGAYDFSVNGASVVTLNAGTFNIVNSSVVSSNSDILWGSAIFQDASNTYIFGTRNNGFTKDGLVARVPTGSPLQNWNYYNGYSWTTIYNDAKPILSNLSDYYSVFNSAGALYLLSQSSLFGQQVNIYRASLPEGHWDFYKLLYCRADTEDKLISSNIFISSGKDNGNTLICGYALIDKSLITTTPHASSFINISNWK